MPTPVEVMLGKRANVARHNLLVALDQFHVAWMRALLDEPPQPAVEEIYDLNQALRSAWGGYIGEVSHALMQLGVAKLVEDEPPPMEPQDV